MRLPALPLALVLSLVLTPAGAPPARAADPLWTESQGASAPPDIARLNDFMHDLSERMKPSLVQVRVLRVPEPAAEGQEPQRNAPDAPPSVPPRSPEDRRSSGSGFLIREDGYLVTNAHVVGDAERIQVRLHDGRRFDARLVGLDERVDLALLKIEAKGLPVAQLGDSNRTRVGEFVLALGHPFGLEQTVSFGIVSRKGAPLQVAAPGFEFIQTDAAVNPGNSGGPLVNMAGEVVGVNSMAAVNGTIGFAIPVNLVKALLPQLALKGKVEWGWLGVSIAEVPDEDAAQFGLKEPKGVLIRQVVAGQPADRGGIKANDVVLAVDGTAVEGPPDLQRIIASTPVGKTVRISLMREGKETEVAVTVGAYHAAPAPAPRRIVPTPMPPQPSPQPPR
jgi:serine protease Do